MKDAQALFQEGVAALRDQRDVATGRRLLMESLRADPQNDMGWVWLARTTRDVAKRRDCLQRALGINPHNEAALKLMDQLDQPTATTPQKAKTLDHELSVQEEKQIALHLKRAEHHIDAGDPEAAIEEWVNALHIQVDHPEALRQAVGYLSRMKYMEDARELVWRAIKAGTQYPSVYLTAIDIARFESDYAEADVLREDLVKLPTVDDDTIVQVAQGFIHDEQALRALDMLNAAAERRPDSQPILTALGDLHKLMDNEVEAMRHYDRAARLGSGTRKGREADKKLLEYAPVLTDRERGNIPLAWREAAGFGLFFLFMGWQDAGLNLLQMGFSRWIGIVIGLLGGYLVITATSSPQQQPLAKMLGGYVPDFSNRNQDVKKGLVEEATHLPIIPPMVRVVMGIVGAVLLLLAVWLVFNTAINLLFNPVWPDVSDQFI